MVSKTSEDPARANRRRERITITAVRASFNRNVKNHISVTWFGRPIADVITPLFYNRGWTANGVTQFRIFLAALALVLLVVPLHNVIYAAPVLFYFCFILDCVDGNIARLTRDVTYWGKFIDGLADFVFVLGGPIAAGVGIWLSGGPAFWMLIGALITLTSVTSQMVRSRLSFMREWMIAQSGPILQMTESKTAPARRLQATVAMVYVNGTFLCPLFLFLPDGGPLLYLSGLLGVQLLPELVWISCTLFEGRIILDRSRRSIHSPSSDQFEQSE